MRPSPGASGAADEHIQAAFRLAYFIHPDRELAIQIAKEAMDDLDAAKTIQRRRLYYTPNGLSSGCAKPQTPRTKVVMAEAHLLRAWCTEPPSHMRSSRSRMESG